MESLDKSPTNEVTVKVKFNGSKFAMGSSKTATAVVPVPFMQNITQLNKAMLERIVILTSKKKNQDRGLGLVSNHNKKRKLTAACSSNGYIQEVEDLPRNPTQGGLCLPQDHPISTINSIYYPLQSNRKLFQKAVEDIDIDSMPITCDFDFWLWLEAQKIFSPFSYKTHDLNAITMQDVGHAEVLSRWCMPAFRSRANTTPDVNHTTTMNSCNSTSSSSNSNNTGAGSSLVSTGDRGMVAQYATTTSRGIDDDSSSMAHIPCAQAPAPAPAGCVWKSTTTITTTTREETAMSSSSTSQAFPNLPPLPSQQQLQQQNEAPFVLPKGYTDLDEYIKKLKSQLLHENLDINQKLTRLRCNSLQTIPIRTELEESMKQIEKERLILLKWRKSKSYIPPGGINLNNNTSISNNYIGNIKGKSNYKRKHSSY